MLVQLAAEKLAAEQLAAEKLAAEKLETEEIIEKVTNEKITTEKVITELTASEQLKNINDNYVKIYSKLALFLVKEYNMELFLDDYICVGTEDFFAYSDSIKIQDINNMLELHEKKISFINLRITSPDKQIQQLNNHLINMIVTKNIAYMSIINLKMSKNKMALVMPNKKGISIWNREKDCNGLYELFEMISEKNDYVHTELANIEYYSFGNYLITDKPSHYWLNNNLMKYSGILISNYDDSLLKELKNINKKSKFFCYYTSFPRKYEAFVKDNEIVKTINIARVNITNKLKFLDDIVIINKEYDLVAEEKVQEVPEEKVIEVTEVTEVVEVQEEVTEEVIKEDKYINYLTELSKVKYCLIEEHDVNLIAELIGLSVIPVIMNDNQILDLEENVHYIKYENLDKQTHIDERRMRDNCIEYYNNKIISEAVFRLIVNHVLVWDF